MIEPKPGRQIISGNAPTLAECNRALDHMDLHSARLFPLVWVRPGETTLKEVRERLRMGAVGLKLHPTLDDYQADDPQLDDYLDLAAQAGSTVTKRRGGNGGG